MVFVSYLLGGESGGRDICLSYKCVPVILLVFNHMRSSISPTICLQLICLNPQENNFKMAPLSPISVIEPIPVIVKPNEIRE